MALRSAAARLAASRVRIALVVLLALLLLHLAFGDRPWDPALSLRFASGQPRAKDYAARFEWWASLINVALAAALLATRRHWLGREAPPELRSLARPAPPTRWQLGLVAFAALVLAAHALPRLGQGLWDDEERTARNAVAGFYEADPSGRLHFHGASWRDTLWRYDPNNHVAYSVLARASTGVWSALSDSPDRRAPEAALRLPALVFGLGSLAAVFGLLWRLGYPLAGVVAAWILALHPWAIRYASEARGYSLEMMLAPAATALLVEALHGGRWRSWLLLAGAEALMLWTYPPALFHLGLLNLAALAALLGLRGGTPALRPQLARWLVASLVAGMLLLQVALPDVPQLLAYLHEQHRRIDARFLDDLLSYFFSGEAWSWRARSSAQFPELARLAAARPFALSASVAATLLALALGALRLLRAPQPRPALLPVLLLGAPLAVAVGWLRGDELYVWHVCLWLPLLACLVALGLAWPGEERARPGAPAPRAALAIPALYLVAFAAWTAEPRAALRERPLEPMRESVAATRPLAALAPGQREVLTASFSGEPFYYDPFVRRIRAPEELRALLGESDETGRELFVNLGRIEEAERRRPELLALVRSPELFDEVAVLDGLEPKHTRRVYRHPPRAGGAGSVAARAVAPERSAGQRPAETSRASNTP